MKIYVKANIFRILGGVRCVMATVIGNGHGRLTSNSGLGCLHISHSTNTLGKSINLIILPSAMGK